MRRVTMSTSSALVAIWAGKPRSWRIQEQLESNNQANSESNPELHWFCFTLRSDWSAKNRAILYQWNALVKQIALWQPAFSRLQAVCWCFSFWFLLSTMSYIIFFSRKACVINSLLILFSLNTPGGVKLPFLYRRLSPLPQMTSRWRDLELRDPSVHRCQRGNNYDTMTSAR